MTPADHWHALYTKHQHERSVSQNLESKGFDVFLPLYTAARKWADRVKLVHVPLFPCYVFLKGAGGRRLDVVATPGVYDFVSSAGVPATIPSVEIENIRRAVSTGARVEPHPYLNSGDRVRVKYGSLAGVEGTLIRKRNVYRLVLSIEMLGRAAGVEIDSALVEKVDQNPSSSAFSGHRSTVAAGARMIGENSLAGNRNGMERRS